MDIDGRNKSFEPINFQEKFSNTLNVKECAKIINGISAFREYLFGTLNTSEIICTDKW